MFEMHDTTYELDIEFDEDLDQYVIAYKLDGEIVNIGRGDSVVRAVGSMYRQMGRDIDDAVGEAS